MSVPARASSFRASRVPALRAPRRGPRLLPAFARLSPWLLLLGLCACAGLRTVPSAPPVWPAEADTGRIFYAPHASADAAAAHRTLNALAPRIRVPDGTASRVTFAEDRGRLRVRMQWRQPEYQEIENPLSYNDERCLWDFFCDSPWPQLERVFVSRDETAVLEPAEVTDIALFTDGRVVAAYRTAEGPRELALAADDSADQRALADALAALVAADGVTLRPGPSPTWAALTPEQAAWLGAPETGVLVLGAPAGSAPARAGLAYPDVVLSVDGRPATPAVLRAVAPGATVRALRWTPRTSPSGRSTPRVRTLDLVWPAEP